MIVLDEQLEDPRIAEAIERWYPGKVINILDARRKSRILDQSVASILHHLKDPTFVTINYPDFWHKVRPHAAFCIVCLKLPTNRVYETPTALRDVLQRPEFKTKRQRMGKILLVGRDGIEIDE